MTDDGDSHSLSRRSHRTEVLHVGHFLGRGTARLSVGSSLWLPTRNAVAIAVLLYLAGLIIFSTVLLARCNESTPGYYLHGFARYDSNVFGWTQYSKIGFTNLHLFHPSEATSPTVPRGLVFKDFAESVEAHPRYSASMWSDLEEYPDPNLPIVAFLDADLCFTVHWPKFGGTYDSSSDTENGRPPMRRSQIFKYLGVNGGGPIDPCFLIDKALASPAMTASPHSRLVVLSHQWYEGPIVSRCLGPRRNSSKYEQLVIGHVAQQFSQVNARDFGIPPWPVKTIEDFPREKVCNDSLPYLLSFKGRSRSFFAEFESYFTGLAANRTDIYIDFGTGHYTSTTLGQATKEVQANETYYQLMTQSQFCPVRKSASVFPRLSFGAMCGHLRCSSHLTPSLCAVPARGDNLFSVRFSEILSAGCIPIIYADGWVLPYTRAVVDWSKLAVVIPQQNVHHTLDYIDHMTREEICERRLLAYDFFHEFVKSGEARVSAIMRVLDERLRTGRLDPFQYAPGISTHRDSLAVYKTEPQS